MINWEITIFKRFEIVTWKPLPTNNTKIFELSKIILVFSARTKINFSFMWYIKTKLK